MRYKNKLTYPRAKQFILHARITPTDGIQNHLFRIMGNVQRFYVLYQEKQTKQSHHSWVTEMQHCEGETHNRQTVEISTGYEDLALICTTMQTKIFHESYYASLF